MKLFFLNNDTLYKLFTTIEKVPKKATIKIFIESENQFFNNPRWAKQITWILVERWLDATFVTENEQQKAFLEKNDLRCELRQIKTRRKILNISYRFFFNIKKFHLYVYQKKNYTFFAVFGAEIMFLIIILYFLYSLILPKTTITITPSYQINEIIYNYRYIPISQIANYPYPESHIIIPIEYNTAKITKTLSIDGWNIQFLNRPAKWTVRIVNTTLQIITLVKNTQLVTEDGIIFLADNWVIIPAGKWKWQAGYTDTTVTAKDEDEWWSVVWPRANITQNTKLIIKKLRQSKYTQEVYAESINNFQWGSVTKSWSIQSGDIGILQKKLYESIKRDPYGETKKKIYSDLDYILLPFWELYTFTGCTYSSLWKQNNLKELTTISGSLSCSVIYPYITKNNIKIATENYLKKRPSNIHNLISIWFNSISFAQILTGEYGSYIIPTKINTTQWYDFAKDTNGILWSLTDQLIWLPKNQAKAILLSYPEIGNVDISISPPWYNLISNLKSRIIMVIKN